MGKARNAPKSRIELGDGRPLGGFTAAQSEKAFGKALVREIGSRLSTFTAVGNQGQEIRGNQGQKSGGNQGQKSGGNQGQRGRFLPRCRTRGTCLPSLQLAFSTSRRGVAMRGSSFRVSSE
jgi:hypothetical protein